MNQSESISELAKALVKVQAEIKPALKDSDNPFFKSKYADLNSVWDSCRASLTKNDLAVAQLGGASGFENVIVIETILMHSSGEWISGEITLPLSKADPQGAGSAITYARRYGLAAMVGIVADVDDDGNSASGHSGGYERPTAVEKPKAKAVGASAAQAAQAKVYAPTVRPDVGKAFSPNGLASDAQLTLLRRKAADRDIDADEFAAQEFLDVGSVAELSKIAASYLIDQLAA